jgi:glucokinase
MKVKNQRLIGIDLGATNVRVAYVEDGGIQDIRSGAVKNTSSADDLVEQIKQMIHEIITPQIEAMGIGVPSVVDVEKGIVYDVQNIPSWKKVPLKKILEDEFKIPVWVNNDANCFVLGEKYFGKAKAYNSVAGLILGTGFASGLIFNGKLYSGPNCGAGEVGMLPYKDSIFEHYCSGQFFEIHKKTTGLETFKLAQIGDKNALSMYKEFGTHLGNAIKAVLYAYDPEFIVLGGSVKDAYPFFKEDMFEAMDDFAYPQSLKNLTISISELEQVAVLGAVALVLDHQPSN